MSLTALVTKMFTPIKITIVNKRIDKTNGVLRSCFECDIFCLSRTHCTYARGERNEADFYFDKNAWNLERVRS